MKSLFVDKILQIQLLQLLLQKSGDYLENIGFDPSMNDELKQQLFELIKIYCTKIKLFDLNGFSKQSIYLALDSIKINTQNLNYISIDACNYYNQFSNYTGPSSLLLLNLGQILPSRLEYLILIFKINTNNLEVFLKNLKNIFIKKLLIKNKKIQGENNDILPYIKKYIMKEKRIKYLAIEETFLYITKELFFSKNEVKEFELHNIQVQCYLKFMIL